MKYKPDQKVWIQWKGPKKMKVVSGTIDRSGINYLLIRKGMTLSMRVKECYIYETKKKLKNFLK